MPYIAPEVILEVKKMDLLTYLKNYEPYELVHFSGNTYTTRTHDSLKISNGKWMWWSRGIGGRSALDYLVKVKEYSFLEAVEILAEHLTISTPIQYSEPKSKEKILLLPKKNDTQEAMKKYLMNRGIDEEIISYCLEHELIYESVNYHNAVFVGKDSKGVPRYASIRGIGTDYIGDANGSDKKFSFSIPAKYESKKIHLFESAIDLLSYATIKKYEGFDWKEEHLLSLAGVYQPAKQIEQSKIPAALHRYLKENPEINEIIFHLDNDKAGRLATKAIQTVLPVHYQIRDEPPGKGKDYNDFICILLEIRVTKRGKHVYFSR